MTSPLRVLSFGAGVQSSAIARMVLLGEIEPIDHAIFADTGDEPAEVYENLRWWEKRFADADIPFHIVTPKQAISATMWDAIEGRGKGTPTPLFVRNADGGRGITSRQCTSGYKIQPINRKIKELAGLARKRHNHITEHLVTLIMGISWDETQRMRDPHFSWMRNEYPLVDRRITRYECLRAITSDPDYPKPPRSACWHCPFHSDEEWRYLRNNQPEDFARAVELDAALRRPGAMGISNLKGDAFLHASLRPLGEVDFDNEEDKGQLSLFGNECEGMCGL